MCMCVYLNDEQTVESFSPDVSAMESAFFRPLWIFFPLLLFWELMMELLLSNNDDALFQYDLGHVGSFMMV